MLIYRDYVRLETNLFPTDMIRCSFTICPCWRTDGFPDYVEQWLDDLSGYIFLTVCELSELNCDVEKAYEAFVKTIRPLNVTGMLTVSYSFYGSSRYEIEGAIKSMFKEDFLSTGSLSEVSLIMAKLLMDYMEKLELD